MRGALVVLTLAAALLAGCGGSEGEAGDEGTASTSETTVTSESTDGTSTGVPASTDGDALAWVEIGDARFEFPNVIDCRFGDAFWGPDFRLFSFDTNGDFPALAVGYAPEKADDEGVEDPNVVAVYPSADPWWYTTDASGAGDMELELTADGARGSATLGVAGEGGPGGEVVATFELSCGDAVDDSAGAMTGPPATTTVPTRAPRPPRTPIRAPSPSAAIPTSCWGRAART